ncbi:hypothetical protein GYB22_07260 [bacterium]|nr:hypothetical protein [bacterium]
MTKENKSKTALECEIIAFRPIEHPEFCEKFVDGHQKVLEEHGLGHLTSKEDYWIKQEDAYAFIALKNNVPVGGIRFEKKVHDKDLPLEKALKSEKQIVSNYLDSLNYTNIYEACGLWNSREVAGHEISIFLCRASIALAPLLGIDAVLSFNGVYTYRIPRELGLRMVTEIGNEGIFKYPVERFHSALWIHEDLLTLKYATIYARNSMLTLRANFNQTKIEKNKRGGVLIHYKNLI